MLEICGNDFLTQIYCHVIISQSDGNKSNCIFFDFALLPCCARGVPTRGYTDGIIAYCRRLKFDEKIIALSPAHRTLLSAACASAEGVWQPTMAGASWIRASFSRAATMNRA